MIKNYNYELRNIHSCEECMSFVKSFSGDPHFSDPMLTDEEQLQSNLLKAISRPEDHLVIGAYFADEMVGFFSFLILREESYAEMLVGLSRDQNVYREMFAYLMENLSSYDVDFIFNANNQILKNILNEKGASFEPEQQKMVFSGDIPSVSTDGVVPYSERYAEQYFAIHNREMYWTGERVVAATDRFRTLLAIQADKVIGYIDVTHCFAENEPFDLFVLPAYRRKGFGKKLVVKALELNRPNGMMLLADADNVAAIKLYESAGFIKANTPNSLTAHWKAIKKG